MKKNNKGFTLVELLAVITLLAVVIAIAAINSTNSLNRGKLKSELLSVKEYIGAVNDYNLMCDVSERMSTSSSYGSCTTVSTGKIKCNVTNINELLKNNINGKVPSSGYVYIDTTTYKVYQGENIKIGSYKINYNGTKYFKAS